MKSEQEIKTRYYFVQAQWAHAVATENGLADMLFGEVSTLAEILEISTSDFMASMNAVKETAMAAVKERNRILSNDI